jgi:hypothetical protein
VADRIGMIEAEVIAAYGKILGFTWDPATGITCLLGAEKIAWGRTSEALADALEVWAVTSGLRRRSYEWVDDPSVLVNEMIASRSF